jgi:hypothetical protein
MNTIYRIGDQISDTRLRMRELDDMVQLSPPVSWQYHLIRSSDLRQQLEHRRSTPIQKGSADGDGDSDGDPFFDTIEYAEPTNARSIDNETDAQDTDFLDAYETLPVLIEYYFGCVQPCSEVESELAFFDCDYVASATDWLHLQALCVPHHTIDCVFQR